MNEMHERVDCAVVGGGMVGLTLAAVLAGAGVRVTVIDREDPAIAAGQAYDGRASAIALGSARVFRAAGLWPSLAPHASPIWDIRIVDGHAIRGVSPLFLHYDHREVGDDPFGYIIENRRIREALIAHARGLDGLAYIAPAAVETVERDAGAARIRLAGGRTVVADLCIAADGKFSKTREAAGIRSHGWSYDQVSLVCTVRHERPHGGVAVELFLPGGPFAMLPMTENRCNIVWSEDAELAKGYAALDDAAFLGEVAARFGDWLGRLELAGPRFAYPLSLSHAETYIDNRLALVGDAAHAIHPIAGQGFNMGLRDVAALAEVLVDAARLGLDPGSVQVLTRYERWRRFDNVLLAAVTDGLTRLFSNDAAPVRTLRDLGLVAVGRLPPLKRVFMRHAMGVLGDAPRLIRGEAL